MKTSTTMLGNGRRLLLAAAAAAPLFLAGANAAEQITTSVGGSGTSHVQASNTQTGTIQVTATALPEIVTETEPCAILCYNAACMDAGCSPEDFTCVCNNPHSLVVKMGLCVNKDCDNKRPFDSSDWISHICDAVEKNPGSAVIASASDVLRHEISDAAATATNNPVSAGADGSGGAPPAATSSSAAAASAGRIGGARIGGAGIFGLTSVVAGLVGGVAIIVAAAL